MINCSLLNTKLQVVAAHLAPAERRIDIKETFNNLSSELMNLLICAGQLATPPQNAMEILAIEKSVAEAIMPVVQFYYFGVAPQDRPEKENMQ